MNRCLNSLIVRTVPSAGALTARITDPRMQSVQPIQPCDCVSGAAAASHCGRQCRISTSPRTHKEGQSFPEKEVREDGGDDDRDGTQRRDQDGDGEGTGG